jgi:hypothetical protein
VFHPRCKYKERVPDKLCTTVRPDLLEAEQGHFVRCHLPIETRRKVAAEALSVAGGGATLGGTVSAAAAAPDATAPVAGAAG